MRAADDIEDYRASTIGAYVQVPHGLAFCACQDLWGFSFWGRPSRADVGRILPLIDLELHPSVPPHRSAVDFRHLEHADPSAFMALAQYLRRNVAMIGRQHTQVAVVRPDGFLGMIVAGFHDVIGARYPVRVFSELPAALAWLGHTALGADVEATIDRASNSSDGVLQLRRWLDANTAGVTLERASRAIGRSPRSLQRALQLAGSSFQRELEEARVRRAKHLLTATDASLTEIGYEVGCASSQHFSVMFRRLSGMPPSVWRAMHGRRRRHGQRRSVSGR